jgi:ankyrin repeat protein
MWAIEKCKTTTVEALCAHSPAETFEQRNRSGNTMLVMAVEKGRLDTLRYMLRAGARASTKDSKGRSAASVARDRGLKGAIVELLLEAEARELEEDVEKAEKLAELNATKAAEKRVAGGAAATSASTPVGRGRSSAPATPTPASSNRSSSSSYGR